MTPRQHSDPTRVKTRRYNKSCDDTHDTHEVSFWENFNLTCKREELGRAAQGDCPVEHAFLVGYP